MLRLLTWGVILLITCEATLPELHMLSGECASIQTADGINIGKRVKVGKAECRKRPKSVKNGNSENDISLNISVDMKENEAFIIVNWTFKGKKIPRRFRLYLDVYNETHLVDFTCMVITLGKADRQRASNKQVMFSLDCLPLLSTPGLYLQSQVYTTNAATRNCNQRYARSAVAVSSGCDVQCSNKSVIHASKEAYQAELCHCLGNPKLSEVSYDEANQLFKINMDGVPPYLSSKRMYIMDNSTHDIVDELTMVRNGNDSLEAYYKSNHSGTFYIQFMAECPKREKHRFKTQDTCRKDEDINIRYISQANIVPPENIVNKKIRGNMDLVATVTAAIAAGAVVFIVTCMVVFTCRWKNTRNTNTCTNNRQVFFSPLPRTIRSTSISNSEHSGEVSVIEMEYSSRPETHSLLQDAPQTEESSLSSPGTVQQTEIINTNTDEGDTMCSNDTVLADKHARLELTTRAMETMPKTPYEMSFETEDPVSKLTETGPIKQTHAMETMPKTPYDMPFETEDPVSKLTETGPISKLSVRGTDKVENTTTKFTETVQTQRPMSPRDVSLMVNAFMNKKHEANMATSQYVLSEHASNSVPLDTQYTPQGYKWAMLLYQPEPEDALYCSKVSDLYNALRKSDVPVWLPVIEDMCEEIDEAFFDRCPAIVYVVSERMNEMCCHRDVRRHLPPCIPLAVLDTLQKMSYSGNRRMNCSLHVVSLQRCKRKGNDGLMEFLNYFSYLKNVVHVCGYNLHGTSVPAQECVMDYSDLIDNLHQTLNT